MSRKSEFNHKKLEGPDASPKTSLRTYGIAWIDNGTETLYYYGIRTTSGIYDRYDIAVYKNDLDIYQEFNWVEDWKPLYAFAGVSKAVFNALPIQRKIEVLLQWYGYENIFGETYHDGLTYKEIWFKRRN